MIPMDYGFELFYLSGKKREEDDILVHDKVHALTVGKLSMSEAQQKEFQDAIKEDPDLSLVVTWYQLGWLNSYKENGKARFYFKLKNDITVENDLDILIVSPKFRRYILELLHETHLGVVKTKDIARKNLYWPGMKSDIESFIRACAVCLKYSNSKVKEPLINHEIPNIPFYKVCADLANYAGKSYLILYDYYSRWLKVLKLSSRNLSAIINKFKEVFSRNGIPEIVIADNMPFSSYKMQNFANHWDFKIIISNLYYPKSNGLAEKKVGIAKQMLRKASEGKQDLELYLLNYRNSPISNIGYTPAQLL